MSGFTPLACGKKIPSGSMHAVSVSLPTMSDLIGYENQDPEFLKIVKRGYPRFHIHPYVRQMQEYLNDELDLNGSPTLITSSRRVAENLCDFAEMKTPRILDSGDLAIVVLENKEETNKKARAYLQHTGGGISSRLAEDFLYERGLLAAKEDENKIEDDAEHRVCQSLADAYGAADSSDVYLASFGMSAIHATYRALSEIQKAQRRDEWVQFGWLFMDTIHIINKLRSPETRRHVISSPLKIQELESLLDQRGDRIAGIFTESPSNPMLQTPDLERLRNLADRYSIPVIVDATLGTPHNVDVLPYADLAIESLTKYANGSADLMMGAVILNSRSSFFDALKRKLPETINKPYRGDIARLAYQIAFYPERMRRVNENTMELAPFFQSRQSIKNVYWAYQDSSRANYEKIHRGPNSPGGLITLDLNVPLESVYDRLQLAKGPSLGAEFTLVGPYLYHAHYDLVSNEKGRAHLRANGLNPELFRVSVGTEDLSSLIEAFSEVL
ncbi:MAG: PLP-dependent transferase [Acidobacteriota bacterium]|nr:PLP-dependent transferase [Acidobacteriota bacterium]